MHSQSAFSRFGHAVGLDKWTSHPRRVALGTSSKAQITVSCGARSAGKAKWDSYLRLWSTQSKACFFCCDRKNLTLKFHHRDGRVCARFFTMMSYHHSAQMSALFRQWRNCPAKFVAEGFFASLPCLARCAEEKNHSLVLK